jgi:NAD+ synthase
MNLENRILEWLIRYSTDNNNLCFVVGVSGGIDSAVVSTLCAKTKIKTFVVSLPIHQNKKQMDRAHNHINWLMNNFNNVEFLEFDLTNTFENFKSLFECSSELSLANSRSRLRMTTLYQISSNNNGIVVGTGNKIEDFGVGFFTKYGDGGVDISPIADLTKTEVRDLAKKIGIIEDIVLAKPTDGLWDDDRTDEDQIGATYEELEFAMHYLENNNEQNLDSLSEREKEVIKIFKSLNSKNKHKMVEIPIFKKL